MKTLFAAYRVTDLDRSLGFYTALGYVELGRVEGGDGARLVILKFPDEPAALTARRRRGSRTRTVTGLSWWSGRPDIPTASPQRTSPEADTVCGVTKLPSTRPRRNARRHPTPSTGLDDYSNRQPGRSVSNPTR